MSIKLDDNVPINMADEGRRILVDEIFTGFELVLRLAERRIANGEKPGVVLDAVRGAVRLMHATAAS